MSDPKHVFISYSRRDGNVPAERLEKALREHGFIVWRDIRDIDPAKDFTADIEKGIEAASHVVVCVTADSKRDDSYVRREIQYALLSKKPVIPLRFADMKPHLPIINFEWVDLFNKWDAAFERLCVILSGEANEFREHKASGDPFQPYLESLYQRTVDFLSRAVIKLIDLTSEETPNAVDAPPKPSRMRDMIDLFFEAQGIGETEKAGEQTDSPLQYTNFQEAFAAYEGRVLLLGEPGAGKTITLMALARDAAVKRLSDPTARLPLLGLISSWDAEKQMPLDVWLASGSRELDDAQVKAVIAEGKALLVLDGLDELGGEREETLTPSPSPSGRGEKYDPRKRFMEAMGQVARAHRDAPLQGNQFLVTCRVKDYAEIGQKIPLKGAVTLKALDDGQMRAYLAEQPELWAAVQADAGLKEMLTTPLLLSFFGFAYRGMTADERQQLTDLSKSPGDLRDKIFEYYVRERYRHEERKVIRRGEKLPFTLEEIYEVLGQAAMHNAEDIFLRINILMFQEITRGLDKSRANSFIETATKLNILVKNEHGSFRFSHLLFRNYFAFIYALPRLRDKSRYEYIYDTRPESIMGNLGDSRAVKPLVDALHDEYPLIGVEASMALSKLGDSALQPLVDALSDELARVRSYAANALGDLGDIRAIEPLISALQDNDEWVRQSAVIALSKLNYPHAFELLIAKLSESNPYIRSNAISALGRSGDSRALAPMLTALQDEDWYVRYATAQAIAQLHDLRAVGPLINTLSDNEEWVRGSAAEALGILGDSSAVKFLIPLLSDNAETMYGGVCFNAARGLTGIGTPEALAAVAKWQAKQGKGEAK